MGGFYTFQWLCIVLIGSVPLIDDQHGLVLLVDEPVSVFTEVDMVVIEVTKTRPVLKIPELVKLLKTAADETGDPEAFEDTYKCYDRWNVTVEELETRLTYLETSVSDDYRSDSTLQGVMNRNNPKRSVTKRSILTSLKDSIAKEVNSLLFTDKDQDQRSNARKFINGQMPKVGKGLKGQVKIDDTVLRQITTVEHFVENLARVETCEMDVLKFLVEKVVNIEQYGSDLESLANVDASGILLRLPHSLRDFKTLKAIASLPRFNGTIYKTEPRLLKSYMELHLERLHLDDAGATFYYTLTYPVLTKSSLIPTFRVEQTGFIVNGRHMMLDLPNQLALIDGRYHEYDCGQNIFDLCRINTTTIRPSCLQESLTDGLCSMIPSDCGDMCSINTRSGLLLTTNHAIHAFLRRDSKEKQMVTIPPVSMSAHFIPWMNYSSVVVMGNGRVIEPPVGQDYEFNILINSDYVNYTTPIFNNVLSVDESGLAVLQEQIEQQKLTIDNITLHIETVKTGMSNDGDSIWSNLSLYLHLGQTIFLLYLLAQLIMCVRSMKFGSVE